MTSDAEPAPAARILDVMRLGRTRYGDAHRLQQELVDERVRGAIRDTLVLTEHEPVITLGRGTPRDEAVAGGIPVVEVERGGEATYHGPGQLVAYPIYALEGERRDLHRYLRDLEEVVIGMLAEVGLEGARRTGLTGVWLGERKICSVGVAVRRWVAWHGFALNVDTDLAAFRGFKPCGLDPDVMTRIADHTRIPPADPRLEALAVKHFCAVFGFERRTIPRGECSPDLPVHD